MTATASSTGCASALAHHERLGGTFLTLNHLAAAADDASANFQQPTIMALDKPFVFSSATA